MEEPSTAKRYVLLESDAEMDDEDHRALLALLQGRFGTVKVIPVKSNPRAVVVKTNQDVSPRLREEPPLVIGGKTLKTVLTSGAIGKLKRRAMGGEENHGQVHE